MVLHYKIKKFSACGLVDHLILVLCLTWFRVFLLDSLLLFGVMEGNLQDDQP
jgi:hypothetical protein